MEQLQVGFILLQGTNPLYSIGTFIVFSAIVYYMTGLRTDSLSHFGWWTLVNVAMQFVT